MARVRTTNLNPAQLARRSQIGGERRARTRAKLMDAAFRLFAVHGADAPTIDDVIAEAGVARGTFYNHFKTRDDLFKAAADSIATSINALIRPALAGLDDAAHRLARAFRMFVLFAIEDETRGWILLRTMPLVGPLNEDMKVFVEGEFRIAVKQKRIHDFYTPAVATDLGLGMQIMTIHRILVDRESSASIDVAAEALLVALGVDRGEAAVLANEPLPLNTLNAVKDI